MKDDFTKGVDQGFAGGLLLFIGMTLCDKGWVVVGVIMSVFGALVYLEPYLTTYFKRD